MELEEQISLKTFIITHALKDVEVTCIHNRNFLNEHTKHADRTSIFFSVTLMPVFGLRSPVIETSRSFPVGHTTLY